MRPAAVRLTRSLVGFVAAMLAPAGIAGAVSGTLFLIEGRNEEASQFALGFFGMIAVFAPAQFVIGAFCHAYLMEQGSTSLKAYVGVGGFVALAASIAMMFILKFYAPGLILTPLAGFISGWVFWLIRRPDRDARTA